MNSESDDTASCTDVSPGAVELEGFELTFPNQWNPDEIEELVDRVLSLLDAGDYGIVCRSSTSWGGEVARYYATGSDRGFVKKTADDRGGWSSVPKSSAEVRAELIQRLLNGISRAQERSDRHYHSVRVDCVVKPIAAVRD